MNQYLKLAGIALFASAIAACSGIGSSVPSQPPQPSMSSSMDLSNVHVMRTRFSESFDLQPNVQLTYGGGPVLQKPLVYIVYWGFAGPSNDPSGEQTYLTNFVSGVGGSHWMNITHQYYQINHLGTHQKIKNTVGQLAGTWVDLTNPVPSAPTDGQIQTEAQNLEAHFGFSKYASYVVATPHDHNSPGFGTQYCAYHGASNSAHGLIAYTNLPYMTDAGFNCGENFINSGPGGLLDGVSIVEGHEYAESQTDPHPFSGWNSSQGEIGDLCAWLKPPAGDITLSTGTFAVQGLWSNANSNCVIHFP